ncbi:MAG: DegT/DnrJ/EryC1/StrS family aminotransferase [Chthoniobacterales bacterium]|nr:DegT/DnrJ/EryC1/StrS family aminotransferase [Chthoniobacterales bacterium]
MDRIPVAGPSITQREIDYVTDAVTNAWYSSANMYHARFETAFASYVGRSHAMALPSCTSAIHLSLLALGIGPGDEVIIPDSTWIASAAPISYVGAIPVFVDIDAVSWCIRPDAFTSAITDRTKAVILVDLYGSMPDMTSLLPIAHSHGIKVIEDAAEAIGSSFQGKLAGGFGDVSVFSFHGSKTLTTGEGGMLVTDSREIYERAQLLRDHGRMTGDVQFFNSEVAYKYKMSSMQAALGLAQLERIEELVTRKREIFSWYAAALPKNAGIELNAEPAGVRNSYWMVTAVWDRAFGKSKNEVISAMREAGIDVRPFFHPLSSLPAYSGHVRSSGARVANSTSYDIGARAVNLPSGFNLSEGDVTRILNTLSAILTNRVSEIERA